MLSTTFPPDQCVDQQCVCSWLLSCFKRLDHSMKSSSALQRLKEACSASRSGTQPTAAAQHSAAASDADNEAYMQEFNQAFEHLTAGQKAFAQPVPHSKQQGYPRLQSQTTAHCVTPSTAAKHAHTSSSSSTISAARVPYAQKDRTGASVHAVESGWRTGPADEAGVLVQLSDRPLLGSASLNDGSSDVVVGSSDHALYVVDTAAGRKKRTLYSKTTGHTEWVTTVCCLPGGRILSGGMDGRLWLWPAAGAAGSELKSAHAAPVSKVAPLPTAAQAHQVTPAQPSPAAVGRAGLAHSSSGSSRPRGSMTTGPAASRHASAGQGPALAVSCSYDKTVKVWDVSGRAGKQLAVLSGHPGPVLELVVSSAGDVLLTGDRKGCLMCWDVSSASSGWGVSDAHAGHITALAWQQQRADSSSLPALSGGQDGCLKAWDSRSGSCVATQSLHADARGKGAIGGIVSVDCGSRLLVVTAGADQTLRVVDPTASYRPLSTIQLTDFPYSLVAVGDGLVACGCGDGSVHFVDVEQGRVLYALGAGRAAVRAMEVGPNRLVCSGDDGCVVSYNFV